MELLEPKQTTRESSLPFLSSLALSVPVSASVQHVDDCSSVAVQVLLLCIATLLISLSFVLTGDVSRFQKAVVPSQVL